MNISAEAAAPHLLAQFLGVLHHGEESGPEIGTAEAACPECGLTRRELHVSGVLGCPACYLFFADEIGRQLETMHRGGRHCGLAPEASAQGAGARSLANLRRQLDQAIGDEAYERAAELRDAIREHAEQRKDGEGVKS
ncbi:MAG: UvrB/UvrC motif-containing protein [Lentisphaeria bacterium]|nr:UvrB/UvrC motif-containing protein [Lentisphaeria bacterium]